MNKYGDFRTYCDEIDSCDLCNSRVRFWCKVKCRIEECSVCSASSPIEANYCPNCGAKMDLEEYDG